MIGFKLLWGAKDGGDESTCFVWGIEHKRLGSVLVLNFRGYSREAYHTHAFHSISWLLKGTLWEQLYRPEPLPPSAIFHTVGWRPIFTPRRRFHKVDGGLDGNNWVLSFRGPWKKTWLDWPTSHKRPTLMGWGRKPVSWP